MKRSFAGYTISLLTILGVINWGNYARAQETATGFVPITVENVAQLELGYAMPDECRTLSSDGRMFVIDNNVYSIVTGERIFYISRGDINPMGGNFFTFSPDMNLLAVAEQSVFEIVDGNLGTFQFLIRGAYQYPAFNPTGSLVAVSGDAVYDTATGERVFEITHQGDLLFSPDGTMLAIAGDAVYDTSTWQPLFTPTIWQQPFTATMASFNQIFSPDSQMLFVMGEGVYDVTTWQLIFTLDDTSTYPGYSTTFNPSSTLLAVSGLGIYDTLTWERVFAMQTAGDFSPDGSLFVVSGDGVYDTQNWIKHADMIGSARFSPDGSYIRGLEGGTCFIFGLGDNDYPFRSGLLQARETVELHSPPGFPHWNRLPGYLAAFARTPDDEWFRVSRARWVAAEDVEIISMPDDVPVENP